MLVSEDCFVRSRGKRYISRMYLKVGNMNWLGNNMRIMSLFVILIFYYFRFIEVNFKCLIIF